MDTRNQIIFLTNAALHEKEKRAFANAFDNSNFTCSKRWLTKFKERYRIV